MAQPPIGVRIRDSSVARFVAGDRPPQQRTLGELLESLRRNALYERPNQPRYFAPRNAVIAQNHTALKTFIGTTTAAGNPIVYGYNAPIQNNLIDPAGALAWANLNTVHPTFTTNQAALNDNVGGVARLQQRAVDVIDGRGNTHSTLPVSGAVAGTVSNNHIIARIRQEIAAGANDERILELIYVMQNPAGHANPRQHEAEAILKSIKTNLATQLNNTIITTVVEALDVKIAALKRQDNSAAKRDVAELERIQKDVTSAKFGTGWVGRGMDNISKFKKSLDILESVHGTMQQYNTSAANINDAIDAIERYDALLRRGNSTERDIDDAYNEAHAQYSQMPRNEGYLSELIESRDNYFKQLAQLDAVKTAKENALEVAPYLNRKMNIAIAVGAGVIGVAITGTVTYWLTKAATDTIPGHDFIPGTPAVAFQAAVPATSAVANISAIPASSTIKPDNTQILIPNSTPAVLGKPAVDGIPAVEARNATPDQLATDATTQAPNGYEAGLIAFVCIMMLSATAFVVYKYASRAQEDKDLDPASNKNLLNIDGIDLDKSQSQIKIQKSEVERADFNIKKRLQNPEQGAFADFDRF